MKKRKKLYAAFLVCILFVFQILPEEGILDKVLQKYRQVQAETMPDPICSYSFNQSTGTALLVTRENDTLEGSNEGTIPVRNTEKTASYMEGVSGKGIYLDGTYGLQIFPKLEGNTYSISFWIKPEKAQLYAPMICAGQQFLEEQEANFMLTEDDASSPIVISTSSTGGYFAGKGKGITEKVWNHVCMTVSEDKVKFYVNGMFLSEGMILSDIISVQTIWYLGIDPYNTLFHGGFDNLEFYNSCLSKEMVSELYIKEKSGSGNEKVTGITLNKNNVILNGYGDTISLYANIEPKNAGNQEVIWSSSNEKTATVENGVVSARSSGVTVVTAVTMDGKFEAQCNITVKDIKELKEIQLNKTTMLLEGDESTEKLLAEANPKEAHLPALLWKTSDQNVAVVDQEGNVKGVANGNAIITAESEDGKFNASCKVTVEGMSKEISIEKVEFAEDSIALNNRKTTYTLTTRIIPENAANRQCTYYSSDEDIAAVDEHGKVTAVGNGITYINVITSDGRFTDSCKVKVKGFLDTKVTSLKLDYDSLQIEQGGTGYLYAEMIPPTATQDLYWSSSSPDIVEVVADEFGTSAELFVYADAVMGSTAMITVSTEDGISAECFVEVTEYGVKQLSFGESEIYLLPGESFNIDTEIKPEAAASADLMWKSSNHKVATVNDEGVIKVQKNAKAGTRAKITSMTLSRQKRASCTVTVKEKKVSIKKLTAKKNNFTLYPGDTEKFSVTYSPRNATENKITYQSQNPKIVKIDKNGKISVPSDYKGTAEVKITAKAKSGKKVIGIIKVKQKEVKIKSLSMSRPSLDVYGGKNTTLYVNYKPGNATQADLTWTSSNKDVVRVTGNGKKASVQVRSLSTKGNAIITAKDANGATASCKVSVLPKPKLEKGENFNSNENLGNHLSENSSETGNKGNHKPTKVELKELSFGRQTYVYIKPGKSKDLKKMLSITPANAEYTLEWKCYSTSNYVTVADGVVSLASKMPRKLDCTVFVESDNGKKGYIKIQPKS